MNKDKNLNSGKVGAGGSSPIGGGKPGTASQDLGDSKSAGGSGGTYTERTPGPGPRDDNAGLMGEEAKSRLDRRPDDDDTKY